MRRLLLSLSLFALLLPCPLKAQAAFYDIRDYGAVSGDGRADSPAINAAIAAASDAGGGTVLVPAGIWHSFGIGMRSNVTLHLQTGSVLKAARPTASEGYVEADADGNYPRWNGSLFYGEDIHDAAVTGPGLIDGSDVLTRGFGSDIPYPVPSRIFTIRESRNLLLRDFSVRMGGARVIWLVGADNVTLQNLKIDSNRDGIDIDCCRHVRVSDCTVNCLNDDAIVLKSSYALGRVQACEDITITGCEVSGFDPGTLLDGSYGRTIEEAPDLDGPTGRIKMGTESVGGFRGITVSNCVFERSRGLALECVDGGILEDVTVSNITMRDITTAPLFLRLGHRGRGPAGRGPGVLRRVKISHIIVDDAESRYASIIAGLEDAFIEDVTISDVHIRYRGGLSLADAEDQQLSNSFFTSEGINGKGGPNTGGLPTKARAEDIAPRNAYDIPECRTAYPEPSIFGVLPAWGFFIRHARRITFRDITLETIRPDTRPAVVMMDTEDVRFENIRVLNAGAETPLFTD
ncbi:MAG: glycoside hydrolase family 28 protein [Bacteroidales bacterium]|nr:glycoside hydrolase family 28 protein [Bacteroidales bacterium]